MFRSFTKALLFNRNHKYCLTTTVKLHTNNKQLQRDDALQNVDKEQTNSINDVLNKYTSEDGAKILNIVNTYNLSKLQGYDISKSRANKLLTWRMRNGLLKELSDIFTIEGFTLKAADKFYQSLLKEPKIDIGKASNTKTAPYTTPSLGAEQRNLIKSCVSIRIGVNSITWARLEVPDEVMNAPCELTHWEHHELSQKKLHLNDLIQRCLYVNHLIPLADCYILENPQMAQASNNPGSVEQQNINIQKAQVTALMGYALASRNTELKNLLGVEENLATKYLPNVFYLRRLLTARLFNHLVGTERVSSEQTVLNLMRIYYNTSELDNDIMPLDNDHLESEDSKDTLTNKLNSCGRVQFPSELRQRFSNSPKYYREFLGQALLLNLAFVRLVLLQDAQSIALVTRGRKNKNALIDEKL